MCWVRTLVHNYIASLDVTGSPCNQLYTNVICYVLGLKRVLIFSDFTDFTDFVLIFPGTGHSLPDGYPFSVLTPWWRVLRSSTSRPTVITTEVTLQHTLRPSLLLSFHCKAMTVFCKHRIHLESLHREIMWCVPSEEGQCQDKMTFSFVLLCFYLSM